MASRTTSLAAPILRRLQPRTTVLLRSSLQQASPSPSQSPLRSASLALTTTATRAAHSIPRPPRVRPREPRSDDKTPPADAPKSESERPDLPEKHMHAYYQLSFTCVPCGHRSHHNVSKQGYHTGSTLITCPECRNRHIISDHLGIFVDLDPRKGRGITVEDIVREKGQLVKKGTLGEDGNIEFWPDDAPEATTKGE